MECPLIVCVHKYLGFFLFTEVEGANDGSAVLLTSGTEVRHRFAHYNVGKEETAVLW